MFSFDRLKPPVSALGTGIYLEKYKIRYVRFQKYLRFPKERKNDFNHRKVYYILASLRSSSRGTGPFTLNNWAKQKKTWEKESLSQCYL
jgi:hypothetical protein